MGQWPDFQDPMDPSKDASNRLKLGTAFEYSAAIYMHYRQIGTTLPSQWFLAPAKTLTRLN
jgi:hypothetical protein